MDHPFHIHTDRKVNPSEFEALVIAAGACLSGRRVRPTSFHDHWAVRRSAAAYPFIAGAFSTFIGDLIVRPDARLKDLGLDLLHLVEETYPGVPVFLRPFDNESNSPRPGFQARNLTNNPTRSRFFDRFSDHLRDAITPTRMARYWRSET